MFESFGFETLTPRGATVILGLILGVVFGALAERSRFCLRRGLVGPQSERRAALGLWLVALAVALLGTQAAVAAGLIDFGDHRFLASDLPLVAIVVGGVLFGAGMVLTRGCASRLTVLAASGNLRAVSVLVVFAVVAHATLKGVLAPVRTALGAFTVPLGDATSLAALPGGALVWAVLLSALLLTYGLRSGLGLRALAAGVAIGLLVPAAWVGTGFVLFDEFDPVAFESLSFTLPATETLFWTIANSAVPAGFGTGLFGGAIGGAALMALLFGSFKWQSFATPRETGRYFAGGAMMGLGGVLAGGCTIGAGLAGVPTLSVAALLAIGAIVLGAKLADRMLSAASSSGSAAPATTQPA
jgi:uncharacterized protein